MATLYRNFPGRRELLEALYLDEVDAVCAPAETVDGRTPGAVFTAWLHRFFAFATGKHDIATELLTHSDSEDAVFSESRTRVLAVETGRSSSPHSRPTRSAKTSPSSRSAT